MLLGQTRLASLAFHFQTARLAAVKLPSSGLGSHLSAPVQKSP